MIVTVFRSRLKPEAHDEYVAMANRMKKIADRIQVCELLREAAFEAADQAVDA